MSNFETNLRFLETRNDRERSENGLRWKDEVRRYKDVIMRLYNVDALIVHRIMKRLCELCEIYNIDEYEGFYVKFNNLQPLSVSKEAKTNSYQFDNTDEFEEFVYDKLFKLRISGDDRYYNLVPLSEFYRVYSEMSVDEIKLIGLNILSEGDKCRILKIYGVENAVKKAMVRRLISACEEAEVSVEDAYISVLDWEVEVSDKEEEYFKIGSTWEFDEVVDQLIRDFYSDNHNNEQFLELFVEELYETVW